ncbi:hypothetical protein V8E55_009641 [Tylopilus felleus]
MTALVTLPTLSLAYLKAVRDVQYQMVAAFSFMVWDFLLTFGEETEYIWPMRHCMLKLCYFYFRYVLLAAQILHLAISPILSSGHMSDSLCIIWYRYVVLIQQISTSMIEIIWATRVYALFNRSRKVGVFLTGLILLDVGLAGTQMVKCPTVEYFETCMLPLPLDNMGEVHTSIVMFVQTTLIGMIVFKHLAEVRQGWGRTPLLSFLVRDATSNYVAVFPLVICGLDDQRVIVVFYWSISLYSAIGCRLILNMEPFTRRDASDEEILFTTHISL